MNAKLIIFETQEEIEVNNLKKKGDLFLGKIKRLNCLGKTLVLMRQLEDFANENLLTHASQISEEINGLAFQVELENEIGHRACYDVQIMNGDDISFKIDIDEWIE